MFLLESPNTVSSIFSICLTLLLAPNGVEGGVFSPEIMKISSLACVHSDLLLILLPMLLTAAAFAVSKLFLSSVRIALTCDCLCPTVRVGIFVRGLIILVLCLFDSSIRVLIWACLQREEIFGSFYFMQ